MVLFVVFLTTLVYVFVKALGYDLSYVFLALIATTFISFLSYFASGKIVLSSLGAKKITKDEYPEFFRIVENLSIGAGLPMPSVFVINDASPNAFATGRDPNHSVICATTGLLNRLDKIELEGVIAHELSHIKNYDIRLMGIVAILVGSAVILSNFFLRSMGHNRESRGNIQIIFLVIGLVFALLSPLIATLIQLAISRKREYLADASAVLLTRYPNGLASALEKISSDPKPLNGASNATAHLFIANPFKNKESKTWLTSLFNTHPPIEERIKILHSM
ncbi:M48 family metallopeptidase [Patescibacteria group bacterium]|nr:M48 family metallopeptidase [Patescibacteria group bacterium]